MNEYARARGVRNHAENTGAEAPAAAPRCRPPPALSDHEKAAVARRRELVHKHMPELLTEIKAMVEEGLIDGWRNIKSVEVFSTGEVA